MGRLFLRRFVPALCVMCLLLTGCRQQTAAERQFIAMDTFMNLSAYGRGAQDALALVQEDLLFLDGLLSVTNPTGEVYACNNRTENELTLSPELTALLEQALILARQTDGTFDPTIYPVVRSWGFTTGEYRVPEQEELSDLLELVGHDKVRLSNGRLALETGMMLDFGGIAKGWAGDRAAQTLRAAGITSAILRLGGNIHTIGTKPDGSAWKVGVEDPATGGTLAALSVADLAVVTSGSYQRNFTRDDQFYHHIIDPATGRPAQSGLTGVTVVGKYGARCDALSTALFVMGLEDAAQFWREHRDFEAVFLLEDGSVVITAGLEDSFALMEGYTDREVQMLS